MSNILKEINEIRNLMNLPLLNESIEGRRCWMYKKIASGDWVNNPSVPNLFNGAGAVQDFLIFVGNNVTKDWVFGDKTATALGTWTYGASEGVNSVYKLWQRMKKDGWDVGETSGYGPKMAKEVASMIIKVCKAISKTCKVDQQTIFDLEYKMPSQITTECKNNLDVQFNSAKAYWNLYLSSNSFANRIKNKNSRVDNSDIYGKVYDAIFNAYWGVEGEKKYSVEELIGLYKIILKDIKGWKFNTDLPSSTEMTSTNPISVNLKTFCVKSNYNRAYQVFVHEIQHILSDYIPLNDWSEVKKAYPLSTDHYKNTESTTNTVISANYIPYDSKSELVANGIDYNALIQNVSQNYLRSTYWCDRDEKISNLSAFRAFLAKKGELVIGGDISVSLFSKYLKKFINGDSLDEGLVSQLGEIVICWAQNNFKPKLSVFINELNSLAKDELTDDKKLNKSVDRIDTDELT